MGLETRGTCLEKLCQRENPCTKAEERKSVVFWKNRKKALLLDHSRGTEGGKKGYSWAKAIMKSCVENDKGWVLGFQRAGFERKRKCMNCFTFRYHLGSFVVKVLEEARMHGGRDYRALDQVTEVRLEICGQRRKGFEGNISQQW